MKDDRPLQHEDFERPERKNAFWFTVAGGVILLAAAVALWSSVWVLSIL